MADVTTPQTTGQPNADIWASWKQLWQRASTIAPGYTPGKGNGLAWQEGWQHLAEANLRLVQGMAALSQHQVALAQHLVAEDYNDLTRLRDGGAAMPLPAQQVDLARRRFYRNLTAMRELSDEMSRYLFDAAETAYGGWAKAVAAELPRDEPIRQHAPRATSKAVN